jgi:ketosteroid isomerase-like protein
LVAGCDHAPPAVDTKAAVKAVMDADAAWSRAAGAMDAAGASGFYADDATVLAPNQPLITGKDALQKAWAAMLVPGNSVSWSASTAVASASGDLVYVQGTYTASMKGPHGRPMNDKGKYLEVWKKQADGSWKDEEDTWNSDLPVMAATPVAAKTKKNPVAAKKKKRG